MALQNLFVSCPSVRGVHPLTMWNVFDMRTEVEKAGHRLHGSGVYRMPLDLARNEMATVFLSTTCGLNLLLDDDVQLPVAEWVVQMMIALECDGCDIVSAPCRMRSEGNLFNIVPTTAPFMLGGLRVVECAWTGLGAVMLKRSALEKLFEVEPEKYRSHLMPERTSAAIFRSRVEGAKQFFIEAPDDLNLYLLDDRVFSMKAHAAGLKIHAAIDVPTVHDGMAGCFSEELEKLERSRAREAAATRSLVGADGRPLGGANDC
jgi:hypothetical protein